MKRLLAFVSLVALVGLAFAGSHWTLGNTEAIQGDWKVVYSDTVAVKCGDANAKTVTVPESKQGYNIRIIALDPDVREESLEVSITPGNVRGVDNTSAYSPVTQFGYNNSVDTIDLFMPCPSIVFDCTTRTAGADAADSIIWLHYTIMTK